MPGGWQQGSSLAFSSNPMTKDKQDKQVGNVACWEAKSKSFEVGGAEDGAHNRRLADASNLVVGLVVALQPITTGTCAMGPVHVSIKFVYRRLW
jgi:hypothetical protein